MNSEKVVRTVYKYYSGIAAFYIVINRLIEIKKTLRNQKHLRSSTQNNIYSYKSAQLASALAQHFHLLQPTRLKNKSLSKQ